MMHAVISGAGYGLFSGLIVYVLADVCRHAGILPEKRLH